MDATDPTATGASRTLTRVPLQTAVKQAAQWPTQCPRASGDDKVAGQDLTDEVRPATSCYCRGVPDSRMASRPSQSPPPFCTVEPHCVCRHLRREQNSRVLHNRMRCGFSMGFQRSRCQMLCARKSRSGFRSMLGPRRAQPGVWTEVCVFVGLNQRLVVFVSTCLRRGGAANLFRNSCKSRRPRSSRTPESEQTNCDLLRCTE